LRWIIEKQAITLSCRSRLTLPLFQFDFDQGCVRSNAAAALLELKRVMIDNESASWLAQRHTGWEGAGPARRLLIDLPAVLAAAQADRSVTQG